MWGSLFIPILNCNPNRGHIPPPIPNGHYNPFLGVWRAPRWTISYMGGYPSPLDVSALRGRLWGLYMPYNPLGLCLGFFGENLPPTNIPTYQPYQHTNVSQFNSPLHKL